MYPADRKATKGKLRLLYEVRLPWALSVASAHHVPLLRLISQDRHHPFCAHPEDTSGVSMACAMTSNGGALNCLLADHKSSSFDVLHASSCGLYQLPCRATHGIPFGEYRGFFFPRSSAFGVLMHSHVNCMCCHAGQPHGIPCGECRRAGHHT